MPILTDGQAQSNWIMTPEEHVQTLHPLTGTGLVTIAVYAGHWREFHVPVPEAAKLAQAYAGQPDVYITQNRFRGPRTIARLWQLDSLWVDMDFYRHREWSGTPADSMAYWVHEALREAQLPDPTFIVATGRGITAVWLHTPIPRMALPRWTACQKVLYTALKPLGADRAAMDAARVFRLVGTVNGRVGQPVTALTPVGDIWDFENLAFEILPLARAELSDLRVQRALRQAERPRQAKNPPRTHFSTATLWEARLSDLQRLRELRWWGELPPGHRDLWLFLAITAMSWLTEDPRILYREARALALEVSTWPEGQMRSQMQAIFKRAQQAAQGKTITWRGREIDPRYHFRNETIIEWLEITPEEQREMRTLIGKEEIRRRHREAERQRTYETGAVQQDRATYLAQAEERRKQAQQMRASGKKQKEIAQALGISQQAVSYLLKS